MTNRAEALFPLVSLAVQVTTVRPTLKKEPERGRHAAGTAPSTASRAVTLYATRARFAFLGTRMVFDTAPIIAGGAVSNSSPGTVNIAAHRSTPVPPLSDRSTVPLPDAP